MVCDIPPSQDYPHTKFGIPTSNNIGDRSISPILLEVGHDNSRNEVRGQGDLKMVCDPPPSQDASTHHFVMPTSNNITADNLSNAKPAVQQRHPGD